MNTFIRSIFEVFVHFRKCERMRSKWTEWIKEKVYVSFKCSIFQSFFCQRSTFATSLLPFEHTRANRSTQSFFVVFFSYSDSFFFATSFYLLSFIFFQSKQNGKQKTAARFVVGAFRCKHEKCAHFNEFYYYFECIFCYLMFKIWLKILIEIRT